MTENGSFLLQNKSNAQKELSPYMTFTNQAEVLYLLLLSNGMVNLDIFLSISYFHLFICVLFLLQQTTSPFLLYKTTIGPMTEANVSSLHYYL